MNKEMKKRRIIIIVSFIGLLLGIGLLSYNFILIKINLTFETINLELYNNKQPKKIEKEEQPKQQATENEKSESQNTPSEPQVKNEGPKMPTYNYIGYLEIPKINLKQGLVSVDSKYNNVDLNIQTIRPSNYPNVDKGNLILASHSGSSSISYFKHLYKLVKGDLVKVDYNGYRYTYQIVNIYTTPKNGQVPIYRDTNITTITLITCTRNDETTQTVYIGQLKNKEAI